MKIKLIITLLIGLLLKTNQLFAQKLLSSMNLQNNDTTVSSMFITQNDSTKPTVKYLWRPFKPSTIGVQLLAGVASEGVSIGAAFLAVAATQSIGGIFAYPIGLVILTPTAICLAGDAMGGNGSYTATFLIGDVSAGIFTILRFKSGGDYSNFYFVWLPLSSILGSIIAYNLTGTSIEDASSSLLQFHSSKNFSFRCPHIGVSIDHTNKLLINAKIISIAL